MNVKRIAKGVAVTSSVILLGGYIAYRAGALEGYIEPIETLFMPSSKSTFSTVSGKLDGSPPTTPVSPPVVMPGSKRLAPVFPIPSSEPPSETPK